MTIKYSEDGILEWDITYPSGPLGATGLAIDRHDNLYITGQADPNNNGFYCYGTFKSLEKESCGHFIILYSSNTEEVHQVVKYMLRINSCFQ